MAFQVLEPLLQVVSLHVGVAAARISDAGPFAKQRAGFVEKRIGYGTAEMEVREPETHFHLP